MSDTKKRFIAGAVCPRCSELDKIVMYRKNNIDIRECINCEFTDEMHFKPVQKEIVTRVNLTEKEKALKESVQIIQFPPKGNN